MASSYHFVVRFDIASYYDSMQHRTLLGLLDSAGVGVPLLELVRQYLESPDLKHTGRGMVAGGALSPLMGALYLQPLDAAMRQLMLKGKLYYVCYMDDMVIMTKTRWHLRAAIRILIKMTQSLGLALHKEKRNHTSTGVRPSPVYDRQSTSTRLDCNLFFPSLATEDNGVIYHHYHHTTPYLPHAIQAQ
jgi:hypothetical protein